ncbi:hypothetical protein M0R45_000733 [Rubus argutus]|uniref:Uncharacterized protein n=1 Tax=Rubus argutus TaxID=59490 RepID=A0AAW1VNG2_RUBAR
MNEESFLIKSRGIGVFGNDAKDMKIPVEGNSDPPTKELAEKVGRFVEEYIEAMEKREIRLWEIVPLDDKIGEPDPLFKELKDEDIEPLRKNDPLLAPKASSCFFSPHHQPSIFRAQHDVGILLPPADPSPAAETISAGLACPCAAPIPHPLPSIAEPSLQIDVGAVITKLKRFVSIRCPSPCLPRAQNQPRP